MAKILVETSARHIHLSQEHVDILFGAGHELTKKKDLSQPGQFACVEKVTVVGPKKEMAMSVLGPCRKATQIELALTDARSIGLTAPIRESGDLAGSAGCKLVGPCGEIVISECVSVALSQVNMFFVSARIFGDSTVEFVKVKVTSDERSLIFDDVVIRVSASYATAMHIDTDESNACGGATSGEIVK